MIVRYYPILTDNGLKQAETFSQYKIVSQNLGHVSITTTDQIYSILSEGDVKESIAGLSNQRARKILIIPIA